MNEHTKEPWHYEEDVRTIFGPSGEWIAETTDTEEGFEGDCPAADANARRIVACVNACGGIPTDDLEKKAAYLLGIMEVANEPQISQATARELLEACMALMDLVCGPYPKQNVSTRVLTQGAAAIAKARAELGQEGGENDGQ